MSSDPRIRYITTVYDAGDFDGTIYIAMHYVEGVDLAQLLRKQGRLEPLAATVPIAVRASATFSGVG